MDYKKQYTDHFNKIGKNAADVKNLIQDYERNTKGLDQARAFKALEGGRQFDPNGGDMRRYNASGDSASNNAGPSFKTAEGYDTSKLDQELVKQAQGGAMWDHNDQARYDALVAKRSEAKDRANQRQAKDKTQPSVKQSTQPTVKNIIKPTKENQTVNTDTRVQDNDTKISNTQEQNVNQNNDQTSTVNGNDNYVYQNQDNSIRNYGGDNRSFVYNSNGEGPDTPATMATLAGYYAPDDSPAAQAKRLDQNVTMNRDNQKKYANTSHIAEGAIARAQRNSYIDPRKLDERIAARSQYHKDQSTIRGAGIFGDIYGLEGPTWNSSKPAKEVEKPDFNKMYDTYTDF